MGRQICFFATPSDWKPLIRNIYNRGLDIIDKTGCKIDYEEIINCIEDTYKGKKNFDNYYIVKEGWNIVFYDSLSGIDALLSEVITFDTCSRIPKTRVDMSPVDNHFKRNGYVVIHDHDKYMKMLDEYMKAPQYVPNPNYVDNGFEHGRFWYATSYYDENGNTVYKSKDIAKEYNAIVRMVKKNAFLDEHKFAYILPDAFLQYENKTFVPCSGKNHLTFSKKD